MKKLSKKFSQNIHARRRAIDRYNLKYNRFMRKELVQKILDGRAKFIEKQSNRVSKWRIIYQGQEFDVIYDNKRKSIVTFLYPGEEDNDSIHNIN